VDEVREAVDEARGSVRVPETSWARSGRPWTRLVEVVDEIGEAVDEVGEVVGELSYRVGERKSSSTRFEITSTRPADHVHEASRACPRGSRLVHVVSAHARDLRDVAGQPCEGVRDVSL
jgi:hypothetical protein